MTMPHDPRWGASDEAYRAWLHQQEADPDQSSMLASDNERDQVCRRLSHAFSEGRITSDELEDRTSRALAARTYGDLEQVMTGLNSRGLGLRPRPPAPPPVPPAFPPPVHLAPPPGAPVHGRRRAHNPAAPVIFWVVAFFTFPMLLSGFGMFFFGDGMGENVVGVFVLLFFLPVLRALYRWGHPPRL